MLDPVGGQQLIYIANNFSNNITAYRGALTPVAGSPFPVAPAFSPALVTADPTGYFLYVASRSRHVSAFTIDGTTGQLTQIAVSPFPGPARPSAILAVAVPIPGGNSR